jgi:hypothetical protein
MPLEVTYRHLLEMFFHDLDQKDEVRVIGFPISGRQTTLPLGKTGLLSRVIWLPVLPKGLSPWVTQQENFTLTTRDSSIE